MAKVAIFLADGFEDVEFSATQDVLNRSNNLLDNLFPVIDTISISNKKEVTGANGLVTIAKHLFDEVNYEEYDCLILPGGKGVESLMKFTKLNDVLINHNKEKKLLAAICAAPQILGKLGLLDGKEVTFYPGCEEYLDNAIKKGFMSTVQDGNIITGKSIGCALHFALQIVDYYSSTEDMLRVHKTLEFNEF